MAYYGTLCEVLLCNKGTQDKGITFILGENEELYLSYKDLYNKALSYLYHLQEKGVKPGDELIFQIGDNLRFICTFWACMLGGIVPVPVSIGNNFEHRYKLLKILGILNNPYLIIDNKALVYLEQFVESNNLLELYKPFENKTIVLESVDEFLGYGAIQNTKSHDTALIQFSSGSTGDPKGVILTHENLLTNVAAILKCAEVKPWESTLSWMPLTHDMGLIGCHLSPIVNNMMQINMSTELFVKHPTLWLKKANEHRVNILQSPNFGYKYFLNWFKPEIAKDWDLSCVRIIYNGAEPINADLCEEFINSLVEYKLSKDVMFPVYGLAEASLAVTYPPLSEKFQTIKLNREFLNIGKKVQEVVSDNNGTTFVYVGCPVENCSVRICDEQNNIMDEDMIGIIQIKGKNVTKGYFNNSEATEAVLTSDHWLNTGDLGFIRKGQLVVTGRKKDIIFVNGQNYYPHDIERTVERIEGVKEGTVVACGAFSKEENRENVCVFVLFKKEPDKFVPLALEIKEFVSSEIGIQIDNIIPVRKIHKTTSGKVQRYKYKAGFESGEFTEVIQKLEVAHNEFFAQRKLEEPDNDTQIKLCEIFKTFFNIDNVGVNDSFFELGGNSLMASQMVSMVYKELGVKIPMTELFLRPTIKLMSEYIDEVEKSIYSSMTKADGNKAYYELSSAQKRLYILQDIEAGGIMYNMPGAMIVEGAFSLHRMEDAFRKLILRHESLRTSFHCIDVVPYQKIHNNVEFSLLYKESNEDEIDTLIKSFIRPFDLEVLPLMRAEVVKVREDKHYLLFDMHHIISDGLSINILIKELSSLYSGVELSDLKFQYKDFAQWQNKLIEKGDLKGQQSYWVEKFSGEIPTLSIPTDFSRPKAQSFEGDRIYSEIQSDLTSKLTTFAKETNATLYMVLLAAFKVLLFKYSGQQEVVIGTPIAGRTRIESENIIGMFVNTLAIKSVLEGNVTFREFLAHVKTAVLEAFDNQDYQFEDLIEKLSIRRDISRNPLFDVMFTLQNMENVNMEIEGLRFKRHIVDFKVAKFDLSLDAYEENGKLSFELEYCTALFKRETVERMIAHFTNILHDVVVNPDIRFSEVNMMSDQDKQRIIKSFNSNKMAYDFSKKLHEIFEENVASNPLKTALVFGEEKISYLDLNEKTNRIAWFLRSKGIEKGSLVGVLLERSPLIVESILAIWKAGGAYIPIDISYPINRKLEILADSSAHTVITLSGFVDGEFREKYKNQIICLDKVENELAEQPVENLNISTDINSLAYVLFTSGSTGKPKGVMIEHEGMLNHIFAQRDELKLKDDLVFAQNASHCFDISVWQFFAALVLGGTTVIYPNDIILEPAKFLQKVIEDGITLLEVVPSYLMALIDCMEDNAARFKNLQYVMVTGETVKPNVVKRWFEIYPHIKMVNAYGPAEASDDIAQLIMDTIPENMDTIPIGTPLNNINIYITDNYMNLCPIGVVGEICVSGVCVGRGYINNLEKTKEVFMDDPFCEEKNIKLYKTGDLGKWLPDGTIEFVGRKDYQVKVRGFRIELGEIESVLTNYKDIKDAVAVVHEDEKGNSLICAYYCADRPLDIEIVKEYLSGYVPDYMVPAYFVQLDNLPLSPNGKVDRKALPLPKVNQKKDYVAPENNIEEKLAEIWKDILKLDEISINDDFFAIGGHSLRAAGLSARIFKELSVKVATRDVFIYPTIRQLADYIKNADRSTYETIKCSDKKEYYELSSAQKRLFVLESIEQGGVMYNMPAIMVVEGNVDKGLMENAFEKLIERHEILRTSFHYIDEEPYQKIHDKVEFQFFYEEKDEHEIEQIAKTFIKPFDLSKPQLIRAGLVKVNEEKSYLFFDMHHIISDGMSIDILTSELGSIYNGFQLSPLKLQYKDFAQWQNQRLESDGMKLSERYWLNKFSGELPLLSMPYDYTRPSIQSFEGDRIFFKADEDLTRELKLIAEKTDTTLFMVLLAAYNILLSKYTGQEDIVVGSPSAGREKVELENMIGMFVNTLALRNEPKGCISFEEFLEEVKKNSLEAFEHQEYQFEELVDKLDVVRDISRNPLFDTMFTMQNTENVEINIGNLVFKPYKIDFNVSKFDLSLDALERNGVLEFEMEYCTALFKKESVERICSHYINILKQLISKLDSKLSEICLISDDETKQIINVFNSKRKEYSFEQSLHQLFEYNTANNPEKTAIVFENEKLTYRELNEKANRIAGYLKRKGISSEKLVGVLLERSSLFVEAVLGIWKAGAAYIPLDVEYPTERKLDILEDSKAEALITLSDFVDDEIRNAYGNIICLDLVAKELERESCENLDVLVDKNNLAYVLFTSGSTGRPKGVMIEQEGMLNHIFAQRDELGLDENTIFAQNANQCFDISVWQFFGALALGGTTVIYPNDLVFEVGKFVDRVQEDKITLLEVVPSYLIVMMDYIESSGIKLNYLKCLIITGEVVKTPIVKRWFELCPYIRMANAYGPAEASDDVTQFIMDKMPECENIPIGAPLNNVNVYIVDNSMKLCPIGVVGEICISGICVGRGYLNDSEKTKEVFVEDLFQEHKGIRMYKTGDLGKWLPNGTLEFIGRKDFQVKIRGFRIELGEIENRLLGFEGLKDAVVILKNDVQGNNIICAYYSAEEQFEIEEIKEHLSKYIPDYMIPSHFVYLENLPLTQSGKVDRKMLPEPEVKECCEYLGPRNEIEQILVEVWQQVLGVERIGINDNFFNLGGDSIKAIKVASTLGNLGLKMDVRDLFEHSVISRLSNYIKSNTIEVYQGIVEGEANLTPVQKAFFEADFTDKHHYNQSVMLFSPNGFEAVLLKTVFEKILEHHDALRMTYISDEAGIIQYNRGLEKPLYTFEEYNLTEEEEYYSIVSSEADKIQSGINLSTGPLVKLGLFKTKEGDHLLIVIHHLVIDGVSWRILLEDIEIAYNQIRNGEEIKLSKKTSSYKDWSDRLFEYSRSSEALQEMEYWQKVNNSYVLQLPEEGEIQRNSYIDNTSLTMSFSPENTKNLLTKCNEAYNTEINDLLLSALAMAFNNWTGSKSVMINLESHGREELFKDIDITRTIGWFTAEYPVVLEIKKAEEVSYTIKTIKETLRRVPKNGIGYGILKYLNNEVGNDLKYGCKPQISFNYLGDFEEEISSKQFAISDISSGMDMSENLEREYMLDITGIIIDKKLNMKVEFNKKQFSETTIGHFLNKYMRCLEEIVLHCLKKDDTELTPDDVGYNDISIEEFEDLVSEVADLLDD